jgi:hypothetical protein
MSTDRSGRWRRQQVPPGERLEGEAFRRRANCVMASSPRQHDKHPETRARFRASRSMPGIRYVPILAPRVVATRCPSSASDTTQSTTIEGILEAPYARAPNGAGGIRIRRSVAPQRVPRALAHRREHARSHALVVPQATPAGPARKGPEGVRRRHPPTYVRCASDGSGGAAFCVLVRAVVSGAPIRRSCRLRTALQMSPTSAAGRDRTLRNRCGFVRCADRYSLPNLSPMCSWEGLHVLERADHPALNTRRRRRRRRPSLAIGSRLRAGSVLSDRPSGEIGVPDRDPNRVRAQPRADVPHRLSRKSRERDGCGQRQRQGRSLASQCPHPAITSSTTAAARCASTSSSPTRRTRCHHPHRQDHRRR